MKTWRQLGLAASVIWIAHGSVWADGRAGVVEFSDGHKLSGDLTLSPGKKLRIFTETAPVDVALEEVKEMRFIVEKEEMREGFYFPNAGQATQAKTGEVYPVRNFQTEITLADGRKLTGHLFTTMLFVETEDDKQKVLLDSKITGVDKEKMADLIYPSAVRFDAPDAAGRSVRIDLSKAGFTPKVVPVVVIEPDLAQPPVTPDGVKAWILPTPDPAKVLFAVDAADGIHVAWPATEADAPTQDAVKTGLAAMHDFFDSRELLGCFAEGDDVYALVLLKRVAETYDEPGKVPWSVVFLHWKYDGEQKKVALLNRVLIKYGGVESDLQPSPVLKEPALLGNVTTKANP
jgi:hypothetical protein